MYSPLAMPTPTMITLGPTSRTRDGASGSSRSSDAVRVNRPVTGSDSTSCVRCMSPPRGRSLRRHPHRRVDGAVPVVALAPLEHLEEHTPLERAVEVQELTVPVAVIEDAQLTQRAEELRGKLVPGVEVGVVVVRDRQDRRSA